MVRSEGKSQAKEDFSIQSVAQMKFCSSMKKQGRERERENKKLKK
jgi:hypothetical protein